MKNNRIELIIVLAFIFEATTSVFCQSNISKFEKEKGLLIFREFIDIGKIKLSSVNGKSIDIAVLKISDEISKKKINGVSITYDYSVIQSDKEEIDLVITAIEIFNSKYKLTGKTNSPSLSYNFRDGGELSFITNEYSLGWNIVFRNKKEDSVVLSESDLQNFKLQLIAAKSQLSAN